MTAPLILPQPEFELVERLHRFLLASGHANCGPWKRDPEWVAGRVECACGQPVLVLSGAR